MKSPSHTVTLSSALRRLLCDHQIVCSADCCKSLAFQLSEGSIARWLNAQRIDRTREIAAEIEGVEAGVRGVVGRVVLAVRGLESEWDVEEFRAFWEQFLAAYTVAVVARQREIA